MGIFRWMIPVAVTVLVGSTPGVAEQKNQVPSVATFWSAIQALKDPPVVKVACCKTCRKGKACGNSCISRNKRCSKPPGCACNG